MIHSDETADDSPCHDLPDNLSGRRVILTEAARLEGDSIDSVMAKSDDELGVEWHMGLRDR